MARKKLKGPTEQELTILSILWKRGPSTVREVNTSMNYDQNVGYTTTLKLMQIMFEKGLLQRDESSKTHIYQPANSEEQIQNQIVSHLMDKVFAGSAEKFVMRVLMTHDVSPEELSKIKKMIAEQEKDEK